MRIAIVHPYPVSSRAVGGTTRVHMLVRHLAPRHAVHVLTHASEDPAADARAVAELAGLGVEQRVFARPHATVRAKLAWALGPSPYFVAHNRNPALEAALQRLDRGGDLDIVHLELAYLAPVLWGLGSHPARILAEQETMSLMIERLRAVPRRLSLYQRFIAHTVERVRRFEAEALGEFDRAFAICDAEAAQLARTSGRPVGVLPHVVSAAAFTPAAREPSEPVVLFVGNFRHDPNLHAVSWLAAEVWPGVRAEVPGARLDVVGPHLPEAAARELAERGARVLGCVEDLAGCYRGAAVFANPILSGGGMRGKVLEAFACGRPVVSTRLGMEGIAAEDGVHCDLADDANGFAGGLVELLRSPGMRAERGRRARELVERLYDAPVVFARLEAAYAEAVAARRARSAENRVA